MDLDFGGVSGVDRVASIRAASPKMAVVILTGAASPADREAAMAQGAVAVLGKDQDLGVVLDAVDALDRGEPVTAPCRGRPRAESPRPDGDDVRRFLTRRELETLDLLAEGADTRRLATALGVRISTARTHVQNLLTKLGVHSRLEAVAVAFGRGWIEP